MQRRRAAILASFASTMVLAFTATASATSFPAIFAYGDSLSDNGNLFSYLGVPAAPYFDGRFSNGPVAVEQLSTLLGAPLTDFAWAGATTGIGNSGDLGSQTSIGLLGLPGMLTQLAGYPVPPALISSSLFVVWGGADDFESGGSVTTAVADIDTIVATLKGAGAQNILVPGLPDLGLTPEFYGNPAATLFTDEFNAGLQSTLPSDVTYFDTDGLLNKILANPSAYGLSNVTTPCLDSKTLSVCSDPSKYLFWDDVHPTTAADAILAKEFAAAVAPVPEPSSLLLLGSGVVAGVTGMVRRRRAA